MKFFAAIVALACLALSSAQMPTPYNCATGATDLLVTNFTLAPYPLCIGQNVCASGTGILSAPVTQGAKLNIVGKYLNRIVYTDAHDLCTLLGSQGVPCPIPITMTSITACVLVKPTAPAGIPVILQVSATNGNGHVLFCQAANGVIAQNCPP
ncbi:hypothetical protein BCR41DRAFT_145604 [Lobosporangium transversale]|uniref:Phosphatidylglycerol/phosphatidylinositol transfer protein n=1 Tax=Lobosporangium transversale TaxID=64571 RepID=A0A1Y2GEF3_9FUNG|nr:hypothetical protein BCR41DRAFT_145604 [Lobosporangium transversale]ORZ08525.1 hypothetical protein BCR41DRAFT_145604 [Lobosporangium transversale]|eukprot:XP_021878453.1 hypothetical protein BCR41DRAFT_145604 [Lobosporangium transversale]